MTQTLDIEDITSVDFLNNALSDAREWCAENHPLHLKGFEGEFDYSIFNYVIDNTRAGQDMRLDQRHKGLIRVSTSILKWYDGEREAHHALKSVPKRYGSIIDVLGSVDRRLIVGATEIDPQSRFVNQMTEFIIYNNRFVFAHHPYLPNYPHPRAHMIENVNRQERGLELWPESFFFRSN